MMPCFFVSDLHGRRDRFRKLFDAVAAEPPRALFVGGDILPHPGGRPSQEEFLRGTFLGELRRLRSALGARFPRVFVILGNDDGRWSERILEEASTDGLVRYIHGRREPLERWTVYGYSFVPPTPFVLKDWERYDISREVDSGCIAPAEGIRTVPAPLDEIENATISDDLAGLADSEDLSRAVFLFHAPPRDTDLDRLGYPARGGREPHVGSVAIRRFIEKRGPLITLHGHIHESARVAGSWRGALGRTVILSAAHDGPELALVRFDLENPGGAVRELI